MTASQGSGFKSTLSRLIKVIFPDHPVIRMAWLFVLFGALYIVLVSSLLVDHYRLDQAGVETTGTVIRQESALQWIGRRRTFRRQYTLRTHYVIYEFEVRQPDGSTQHIEAWQGTDSSYYGLQEGDTVRVDYLPQEPTTSRIRFEGRPSTFAEHIWLPISWFSVLLGLLILSYLIVPIWSAVQRWLRRSEPRNGATL